MEDLENLLKHLDSKLIDEISIEKKKTDPIYDHTYRYLALTCQMVGLFDDTEPKIDRDRFYDLFNMKDSDLDTLDAHTVNELMVFAIDLADLLPLKFQKRLYDVIVRLFNFGADPNYIEVSDKLYNKHPIIFKVVDSNQLALFELFIRKGAKRSSISESTISIDVNVSQFTKQTLFDYTVYTDNQAFVDIMLYDTPENPLVFTENPLINVYKHFGLDMVKRILQKGIDMDVSRYHGTNVLTYVDNVDFCKAILDFDRSVLNETVYGDSILCAVLMTKNYDIVQVLLEYGARFNEDETFEEIGWMFEPEFLTNIEVSQTFLKYRAMPEGYVYQDRS